MNQEVCKILSVALWGVSVVLAVGAPGVAAAEGPPTLVVAAYDSLVSKHGLGPAIVTLFEKKCGCKVQLLSGGSGTQFLSRLQIDAERGKHEIDVVWGLDQSMWERAKPYLDQALGQVGSKDSQPEWAPEVAQAFSGGAVPSGFVPYDYGVFALIADQEALTASHREAPRKLSDLQGRQWRRSVILEDPRTSAPGLAFMLLGQGVGGERFWPQFRGQWLTLTPGWDAAYALFLKKEAPLVWSYTTSQAYHEEHGDPAGDKRRYRAVVFEDGNPVQVEGAAIVKGSAQGASLGREFLAFLGSADAQALVPLKNWMFPVRRGVELPASFKTVPKARKIVVLPSSASEIEAALNRWKSAVSGSGLRGV